MPAKTKSKGYCPRCIQLQSIRLDGRINSHTGPFGHGSKRPCPGSGAEPLICTCDASTAHGDCPALEISHQFYKAD